MAILIHSGAKEDIHHFATGLSSNSCDESWSLSIIILESIIASAFLLLQSSIAN
jgi:hypothetical protein